MFVFVTHSLTLPYDEFLLLFGNVLLSFRVIMIFFSVGSVSTSIFKQSESNEEQNKM